MTTHAKPNPKTVFVNRYFYPDQSATSQLLSDLAFGLAKIGLPITIVCSRQRYDAARADLSALETIEGVSVHRVWTTRFGRDRLLGRACDYLTFYLFCTIRLLKILKRGDTVVAKTDPPLISVLAVAAARMKGATAVNWLQDIFPEVASLLEANPLPQRLDALLRRVRDRSLQAARMNVVIGGRMRERLLALQVPAERIQVIENWADAPAGAPKPVEQSELRRNVELQHKFVVGYSGNLGRAHEYQTLLEASQILRDDPDFAFLMIGGGVGMAQLRAAVAERRLLNFYFLPYQPRDSLSDSLAAADVHWVSLVPALEGLIVPSKFYGILAAARPVIFIGDTEGEIACAIRDADCGCNVSVGDAQQLADRLRELKASDERRSQWGKNGYRRYHERYSAQRVLSQWTIILNAR
jgi:colanic acid biosynthesis glycosyl transferase WcaI